MSSAPDEPMPIRTQEDVVRVRQAVRRRGVELALSLVDQTKIVTAASELARNALEYGGGGSMTMEVVERGGRRGLQLCFQDEGPGIDDLEQALRDGFSSGKGLGLGLGGARRLCHEFEIDSGPGKGTRVTVVRWK